MEGRNHCVAVRLLNRILAKLSEFFAGKKAEVGDRRLEFWGLEWGASWSSSLTWQGELI